VGKLKQALPLPEDIKRKIDKWLKERGLYKKFTYNKY